jgi:TIGR03663 family protein
VLSSLHRWLPLVLIATAALWLRTTELARRPMHADEANQAVKLGQLLDTGDYAFDPADHHGPTLYFLAVPLAWLRNETSLATLTETTVRLLPALAGTLAVLLLSALASPPTEPTANTPPHHSRLLPFTAAIFLTVSPPAVYYSRYFIQETLLLAFTLATFLFAQRWWRTAYLRWALLTGVSIGLMQATKASAPLFLLCAVLAALPLLLRRSPASPARASLPRHGLLALAAALFTAAIFYSSFFTHLAGLRDALATYTHASSRAVGETGHEKPFAYYFQLLAFHRAGGLTFHQIPFLALAAIGAFFAFRRHASPLLRWAALYTLLVALALSLTPYKTPWHVIHLVPGLSLLAAGAIATLRPWWLAAALGAFALTIQIKQTQLTSFLRPADARNPYAYVHSSPDVLKLRALADSTLATSPDAVIRVIATEYWPIPWYLRGLEKNVGYWSAPPADSDAALIIASADLADSVRPRLTGNYRESLLGLRPGVLCVVFTREP